MIADWQTLLLEGLTTLDTAEGPHGLYGIRAAYAKTVMRWPTLAHIFASPKHTNLIQKLGFQSHYAHDSYTHRNEISFLIDAAHAVDLRVLDHASTKVRQFGSAYHLDLHHGKQPVEPQWDLERLVPKLAPSEACRLHCIQRTKALLLIAHAPNQRRIRALLRRAGEEEFLERYAISLSVREWEDRYGRGFCSGLYLWNGLSDAYLVPAS